jgi:hypothetical protein
LPAGRSGLPPSTDCPPRSNPLQALKALDIPNCSKNGKKSTTHAVFFKKKANIDVKRHFEVYHAHSIQRS